jgi:alcohol dehydrogenase class IV
MSEKYIKFLDSYPDTEIHFGAGVIEKLPELLKKLQAGKISVFTGKYSADKNGSWQRLTQLFEQHGITYSRFSEVEPEPAIATVNRMTRFLNEYQPDAVVALGGGSVLDAAKAAYLLFQAGGELDDYFGMNRFSQKYPEKILKKVICLPTTSGTGSEATPYSNIVDPELQVKKLVVEKEIIPQYSFIDPTLSASMPETVTVATAFDAMAHSLEGFLNVNQDSKHPEANNWALESIRLIVENLPLIQKSPESIEARTALAAAACLGGMVIRNKSTGLPHLCSFSWFGKIEHGIAVAVLLPYAWKYYLESEAVRKRTMELKEIFGGDSPEAIVNAYCDFMKKCGLKTELRNYGLITPELLKNTAKSASENQMKLELAPKPVPLEESFQILDLILNNAWEGKLFNK